LNFAEIPKAKIGSFNITIRKHDLEIVLQGIQPHPNPTVSLEQYTTPADFAADLLFRASYTYGDIVGKSVADLGTGTGRLAIGASLLGAEYVVGVDVDLQSLGIALLNSRRLGTGTNWILGDINELRCGSFDTVVMNPPFGTKREHSDIRFLKTALKIARIIYSVHKSSTHSFISRWLMDQSVTFETLFVKNMAIGHQFSFHRKRRYLVQVELLRIVCR